MECRVGLVSGGLIPSAVDVGESIAVQEGWAERDSGSIKNLPPDFSHSYLKRLSNSWGQSQACLLPLLP